ncbi:MAG: SDR family oxidoreductase [Planctomycetes bacterium]|nr:SDR family oxidoreductase [Planctomycetota bacterium]MBI3845697.1 SDR family oxidoreductase [Planctomycetota bacterium]
MSKRSEGVILGGHVAIVTGGGRGIGRATARGLAAAGAAVVVVARTIDEIESVADEIRRGGGNATAVRADVTNVGAVQRMVAETERIFGPPDLLVNVAGVAQPFGPAWQVDPEDWWRCLEVNLRGPFLCARAVLPVMIARRRGRIINVSSGSGTVAIAHASAYVTSKTALIRFSEVLALEVREHGVAVFAIEPGTVRTSMTEDALQSAEARKWLPWFPAIFEEKRDVTAEHSAELIVSLASGMADALSGRFISRADDLTRLVADADAIRSSTALTLRIAPR